jgi:DNA polymerase elongation subunit (family B)
MKRLVLDIETAPNTVFSWGLFNQNIAINQISEPGYTMCVGAKWYGEDDYYFASLPADGKQAMLDMAYDLMEEADAIIHYNGTFFDIPTLNREFVLAGMTPPARARDIDLLQTVRKQFKFPSNKLAYVAHALGVGEKPSSFDMDLWRACMRGEEDAWVKMEEYNVNDLFLTEEVYDRLVPWVKNHPNFGLYGDSGAGSVCPHCGSHDLQKRGFVRTKVMVYQRYRCNDCGAWSQTRRRDKRFNNDVKGVA